MMIKTLIPKIFLLLFIIFSFNCESSRRVLTEDGEPSNNILYPLPWNAIHIGINSISIDRLIDAVNSVMPRLGINLLIVEVNYNFEYDSYPQLRDDNPVSKIQMQKLISACRDNEIRIIPQFQSLGHQSWSTKTHPLLKNFPEFDETPMIPLDNPGIYCRNWCPLNPDVYDVVFTLIDELIEVFTPNAFHVGMDEVRILAHNQCNRCRGYDPAVLYAKAVRDMHAHISGRHGLKMLMWGDMLIDPEYINFVAGPLTHRAVDMIPKDIIICDWQYGLQSYYPSIAYFIDRGFEVLPSSWDNPDAALALMHAGKRNSGSKMLGHLFTVWGGSTILPEILIEGLNHDKAKGHIRGAAKSILDIAPMVKAAPKSTLITPRGTSASDSSITIHAGLYKVGNYDKEIVGASASVNIINDDYDIVKTLGDIKIDHSIIKDFKTKLIPGNYRATLLGSVELDGGERKDFEIFSNRFGVADPISHDGRGAVTWVSFPPSPKYPANGAVTLTDGIVGPMDWDWGDWLSFEGLDLEATLDLGEVISIQNIQLYCLQNQGPYVFMPTKVYFLLSTDGITFNEVSEIFPKTSPKYDGPIIEVFDAVIPNMNARYVRVKADNIGKCPDWHPGSGAKAWLMAGEVIVNKVGLE